MGQTEFSDRLKKIAAEIVSWVKERIPPLLSIVTVSAKIALKSTQLVSHRIAFIFCSCLKTTYFMFTKTIPTKIKFFYF